MKKIPQTDAIFDNVFRENQASDENPRSLRVSIDTKAKVKIGNLSRGGKARTLKAKAADDHDTQWQSVLVPFGILNTHMFHYYQFTSVSRLRLVILSSIV
ncbi:ISAzo13-like element transposase-related protein [Nostoc sp.]|uniref:ISAzo13-like element transposase-related protein n=1 Tax=Nostoc sp. TaxID=1180 RepID=UPI002FFD3549